MSSSTIQIESPSQTAQVGTRFHISLNVASLDRSVEFFQTIFGVEPAKCRVDYAKFELHDPPLVLSLEPIAPRGTGALNHLGFRVPDAAALVEMQRRLETAGISTQREEGVECCYSRQTKFWLHDPDGNLWEVYTLDEDLETRGMAPQLASLEADAPLPNPGPPAAIWAHRIGQPFPHKLFVQPGTVDEAKLQGTFNLACTPEERRRLLAEVYAALKPGGQAMLHQLTGDRALPAQRLQLPGPAAVVEAVPQLGELVREVEEAGFARLRFERLGDAPCFVVEGVEMRETILIAEKAANPGAANSPSVRVLYKGPFRQVSLENGAVLRRGEFALVDEPTANALRSANPHQFVVAQNGDGGCQR